MITDIFSAIVVVFEFQNLLAIFIGVAFGIFMGAVPGLTATMGIALVIPLTYNLDTITAFCILLGAYKGSLYSGCIPAILINTPGTPAAAATVMDGFPLTQKGRGSEAMGVALWSSVIGDVISTIVLIFGAVFLGKFATNFGPAEFATLVLFSLSIVASVSGNSLIKGLIAASLGFLFGTVGLDPIHATPRFTFGSVNLMNGISIMAMLIGLFAVSELLVRSEDIGKKRSDTPLANRIRVTWQQIRALFPTIFRGSIIGTVLGAIPGLGATPAAFLSYSEAKRNAKQPEEFGKGSLEGVAACESANNATCGGALIPLMALGVPGDVTTAVLLGAFLIHGLAPGPMLFTDSIDLVYAIFIALLTAALMLPVLGVLAIRLFSHITRISPSILYPMIAILCVLGVYGFNSSVTDLWVMLFFGLLGYVMRKFEFPLAPMMIGFVLEPIGESSARQALTISSGDWSIFFSTPISVLFLVLTAASITLIGYRTIQSKRTSHSGSDK